MKKSLLALSAAAIALSGMAATPKQALNAAPMAHDRNQPVKVTRDARIASAPASMKKAPARINTADDVISSVDGTRQEVVMKGSGYMEFWGGLYYYIDDTVASHVVYGDNDEVYIYNIIPNAITDTYVKGVRNGDKVVVDLPQTVLYWPEDEEEGYPAEALNLAMFAYDEELDWYVMTDESSVTFSVAEDGTMTAEGLDQFGRLLSYGYASTSAWSYYAAWDLSITPFNDVVVSLPDDYVATENFWILPQEGYGQFVNFAQGGDEVYFQGICASMPEAWMKASVEYEDYTATVSIPQNQCIGLCWDAYYMYTKCAKVIGEDDYGYPVLEAMPDDYAYQLVWDFEEETLKAKDSEVVFIVNFSDGDIDYLEAGIDLSFIHQDSFDGTPAAPYDLEFADFMMEEGFSQFTFKVPAVSVEGDYLLTGDLSYVVYVDGEEWTFDADDYGMPESIDEIPWNFTDDDWFQIGWDSEIERSVFFLVEGITTLGVQSVYRYNGEETRSEIVTLDLDDPSAVNGLEAGKKIADVKYYGLDGREVANPGAGIFVKRVTFDDGSVATFKKAVR